MTANLLKAILRTTALVGAGLLLSGGVSHAASVDVFLQAQQVTKTLPDGTVPMWVFVCDPGAASNPNCSPQGTDSARIIDVNEGDDLTIHLSNALSTPTSIIIPGQAGGDNSPIMEMDLRSRNRVRSFTTETNASTTHAYTWLSLRAGTYLYQSGTRSPLQVPMGLQGALVVNGSGCVAPQKAAYGAGSCYDAEALLLLSEIDAVQNRRVQAAADVPLAMVPACEKISDWNPAGTPGAYPCTIDYAPTYFLVNGEVYDKAVPTSPLPVGAPGKNVLLRLLNAGLRSHVPTIAGLQMGLIAEDGFPYPGAVKQQSEALMGAGKTRDVIVATPAMCGTPAATCDATYPVFDRMAEANIDDRPLGGMLAYLVAGAGGTPISTTPSTFAVNDTWGVTEDTPLNENVLANDVGLGAADSVTVISPPTNGVVAMNNDGSFTYTPNANFSGTDTFMYSAMLAGSSYPAQVTLNVSFEPDPPLGGDDSYTNTLGLGIAVSAPGVLGNDQDVDGDTITAVPLTAVTTAAGGSVTLNADGSFSYSPPADPTFAPGADSFVYEVSDGTSTASATVYLTINPIANITLNVQEPPSGGVAGAAVPDYRWVVQEDAMYHINPLSPPPNSATLSTSFHRSYMPVVAQGCVGVGCATDNPIIPIATFNQLALDPTKHYYVSVLPNDAGEGDGHTLGAAQIAAGTSGAPITVIVAKQPIPTAQISVLTFADVQPTNGVPDVGEPRLGGFTIILEDAGGRYGQAGGTMSQDAFGNPLMNSLGLPVADGGKDCFAGTTPPQAGVILTCPDTPANQAAGIVGQALVRDLHPGKFGVIAVPPLDPALAGTWTQTSTIEGTKVIDTWVKAGEPPYFVEFGVPSFHAFIGFVNPANLTNPGVADPDPANHATGSVSGNIHPLHSARPPSMTGFDSGSYDALAHTRAWVGLNSAAGTGPNIAAVHAEPDGSFTIENVPDGVYQLVVWDDYLDQIIFFQTVNVSSGAPVAMGNISVPTWFGRQEHTVFLDLNENGIRDEGEPGLPEQAVNQRFRDGTVALSFPTDTTGFVPFDQTFPYGSWQVAEIDFTRFKPTGVTVIVDGGGDVSGDGGIPGRDYTGLLNPQLQGPCTQQDVDSGASGCTVVGQAYANPKLRTETGPVLTMGFQSNPGMNTIFEWGKKQYAVGENGGIAGIVFYGSTRGENDPRLTVGDPWEPGIPGVKVRLFKEIARSGGGTALALVEEVTTDKWDDSLPTGCAGEPASPNPFVDATLVGDASRCFDGVRNFEQVRPAIFDGGYAFNGLAPGTYVVEVVPPPGYELIKEEDVNVGFGDAFVMMLPGGGECATCPDFLVVLAATAPEPGILQPACVGALHTVKNELSLFPGVETPYHGMDRPLCDRKRVVLNDQSQGAADFHLFTSTPVGGQAAGLTTDDVAVEQNPASPSFGDKWGPAYMPFSMRDFLGNEVYRGITDAFGRYNAMLPSTFTANIPVPSGYSPGMHQVCLNDPGPITNPDDPTGPKILDPNTNPNYGSACYTLMYMPGATTYLDTPLLPSAAFAAGFNSADCAGDDGMPKIASVNGPEGGPLIRPGNQAANRTITINAQGLTEVANPAYEGPLATAAPFNQPTIVRDFGFGDQRGEVHLIYESTPGNFVDVAFGNPDIASWTSTQIVARVPGTFPNDTSGQLVVIRGDNGRRSVNAVTVTRSGETPIHVPAQYATIQAAIDNAAPGSLILVAPGAYEEIVVMDRPVRLQGYGAATIINAVKRPPEKLADWRAKVQGLIDDGSVSLVPGQDTGANIPVEGPAGPLQQEQGAGITVLADNDPGNDRGNSFLAFPSRIDGFTITSADGGGGIFVNGYAHNLVIANNNITKNIGILHGGIRVGHPFLATPQPNINMNVNIHHNAITRNGNQSDVGVGGGLAMSSGSNNYRVAENFVCGNFSLSNGGGISHLGLSNGGRIEFNDVRFNQSFNPGLTRNGGGIYVGGEPPVAGTLTAGTGNVSVKGNAVQGNQAGSGHGGGIRAEAVNGTDTAGTAWSLTMTNNMVVNNVAGWSGGGISLQDAISVSINGNTVANNDSTATAGPLVAAAATLSAPQPAGISAEPHSLALAAEVGAGFSNPELINNIVWHNRSFSYDATAGAARLLPEPPAGELTAIGQCQSNANYWDLGVLGEAIGSAVRLSPSYSLLSTLTYDSGNNNVTGNAGFMNAYCNGARTLSTPGPMQVAAEVIEGGNFIDVRYGPLTQIWPVGGQPWNYHLLGDNTSAGRNAANSGTTPPCDFDRQQRGGGQKDIGADEISNGTINNVTCY
jgi:hypothetical protein